MSFSFIFIGSTHGFIDDFIKQKEIISSINPEYILAEDLEDLSLDSRAKFEDLLKKRVISNMTSFVEVERLVNLCYERNIKLIGIDLPNFGFDEILQEKIKKQESLSEREEEKINEILKIRERLHLRKILEYKKRTNKPLVIIVGSWHLQTDSLIMSQLNNYRILFPCDKEGNLLIGPSENKKINYCEKIKND